MRHVYFRLKDNPMKTTMSDLLLAENITPHRVLALRHLPSEPELNKVLPMLAARKPEVFNAYQATQGTPYCDFLSPSGMVI
jgi:hypothetical protein